MNERRVAVRIRDGVDTAKVEGRLVLLEPTGGRYLSLDRVGTRIWELLQQDGRVETVIDRLQNEFDVGEKRLRDDVDDFLDRCQALRLIEPVAQTDG